MKFFSFLKRKSEGVLEDTATKIMQINCISLVSGTEKVPRLHCNMGDGREGDCPIYLNKHVSCKYHSPKFKPLNKGQIEAKLNKLEEDKGFKNRCLASEICPSCGHDLKIIFDDYHDFVDGFCPICSVSYVLT